MRTTKTKIKTRKQIRQICAALRKRGRRIVFTNGTFDLLHAGHVAYLEFARRQGDVLVVGVNSDASVRRYKGPGRPIQRERDRARILAALECVDYVVIFGEDEPRALIVEVQPDVLVKGADWAHYVSGRDVVEARGGRVVLARMMQGRSTSDLIRRIQKTASVHKARETGSKKKSEARS